MPSYLLQEAVGFGSGIVLAGEVVRLNTAQQRSRLGVTVADIQALLAAGVIALAAVQEPETEEPAIEPSGYQGSAIVEEPAV